MANTTKRNKTRKTAPASRPSQANGLVTPLTTSEGDRRRLASHTPDSPSARSNPVDVTIPASAPIDPVLLNSTSEHEQPDDPEAVPNSVEDDVQVFHEPSSQVSNANATRKRGGDLDPATEAVWKAVLNRCEFDARLSFLMKFDDRDMNTVLEKQLGGLSRAERDEIWATARQKYVVNIGNWRAVTKRNMQKYVKDAMQRQSEATRYIKSTTNIQTLASMFNNIYSPSDFEQVFDFCKKYIAIADSSDLAKSYCRTMFVALAARVKMNLDWKTNPAALRMAPWNDSNLQSWICSMGHSRRFSSLTVADFKLRSRAENRDESSKRRKIVDLDEDDDFKVFDGSGNEQPRDAATTFSTVAE